MTTDTVTKSQRFYCVSLTPDICKTPVGSSTPPLPYTIVGEFSGAQDASPNVKSHSEQVILHQRSTIPTVKGDAAGSVGGVKSGTVGKQVDTKEVSQHHRANGASLVQVGREVWMNARNTVGKIYERGEQAARPLLTKLAADVDESLAGTRDALKPAAQEYKDKVSAPLHDTGARLMAAGGKVATAGMATAGAGALASATVIGAPVGVPMATAGVAVAEVGTTAAAGGAAVESTATIFDKAADYILTGKRPDFVEAAFTLGTQALEGLALSRVAAAKNWLGEKIKAWGGKFFKKHAPGKAPSVPPKPPSKPPKPHDNDGKSKKPASTKSDAPSDCCPKNKGPANKKVKGRKPVHFGTGQEILHQTDFVLDGAIPIAWTRCYRSSAESQDWGPFGARWSSSFTASISVAAAGTVYHDESGRALRLPPLAPGQSHDSRKEGFVLARADAATFTLTWRDGSRDTFKRGGDGYLPHGYDGANPMLPPGAPERCERFVLVRSTGRDGRGISIEALPQALPGAALLRIVSDDGVVVEAMREEAPVTNTAAPDAAPDGMADPHAHPRIGRVEEARADGTRICHVRYHYEAETPPAAQQADRSEPPFPGIRYNLAKQSNVLGDVRSYAYRHHLLTSCVSYTGFVQSIEWVSLAALRARWAGSELIDDELAKLHPVTVDNSYQARATSTRAADGSEGAGLVLAYLDIDTTRVTENGNILDYTFDRNWLSSAIHRVEGGRKVALGSREWDRDGMLLADVDALGRATRYRYDAAGNLTESTDAAGHTTRIAYDGANDPISVTDAMGHTSTRAYDELGRVTSATDALGHTTSYRYDDKGRLVEQIDAKGGHKHFVYDGAGRLIQFTDCSGYVTRYHHDDTGRLTAVIDAHDKRTQYAYDALGRVTAVTHPDGTREHYAYDADGNLLVHTDAMGHQTRYAYNGQGLPIERTDALGQTVRYRYDNALQLVELVNANGEPYVLGYQADGWLTSETGFDGKTSSYSYDAAGQLTASECRGKRTELVRDRRGLLVARLNADGVNRYAYDAMGRLSAVAAPQAEQRFIYDALGQLVEERSACYLVNAPVAPGGERKAEAGFAMTHAYDELGNRVRTILPNGRQIDTLRYGSGHWHGTLWQGAAVVDIERDALHRETRRQLGTGSDMQRLSATRSYDPQSRLARLTLMRAPDEADTRPLRERRFSYDPVGNLLKIETGWHTANDTLGTFTYDYDPVGQLLAAAQQGLRETFDFDPAGNLLDSGAAGAPKHVPGNLLAEHAIYRYAYDDQGNVSLKHTGQQDGFGPADLVLAYDADNRVRSSVRTSSQRRQSAVYFYDAFGRRVGKRVEDERWNIGLDVERDAPSHSDARTTLFVWDGDTTAQEVGDDETVTFLYEPDSFVPLARIASAGGARAADHVHLGHIGQWLPPDPPASDARARMEQADAAAEQQHLAARQRRVDGAQGEAMGDRIHYYGCDHLGTPRELVDGQGRVVWSARSKAWGRVINEDVSEVAQPLRFQGQYEDAESGLFYNRYRYYDPDAARYVTQDPIGLMGGLNGYAYAPNPTGWTDSLGLAKSCRSNPNCDPCFGKNPAAWARQWQGHGVYEGRDAWENMVLKEGTVIFGGAPGQSGFYFDQSTLDSASGSKGKLWQSLQVLENRKFGYRQTVQKYRIKKDTCVATSTASAQVSTPDNLFGAGGGTQYYLSDFKKNLEPIGTRIHLK
jgi:RHS repeat-associated protein